MNKEISISYNGQLIYIGKIENLPIKENVVIEQSILQFGDDEPCIIHRSYIIKKILINFIEEINHHIHGNKLILSNINKDIIDKLDLELCYNAELKIFN
ncbi:MAG: hypothetical protein ACERKZ_20180 [Lachnotalea sp.]